jgi:hypothetical protein
MKSVICYGDHVLALDIKNLVMAAIIELNETSGSKIWVNVSYIKQMTLVSSYPEGSPQPTSVTIENHVVYVIETPLEIITLIEAAASPTSYR